MRRTMASLTWAADADARNGEERVSTPKSDGGSTFTSPTKSISFDRSYSISSRATPLQLDPSFVTPSSSRRDLFSTSASMADLSTPSTNSGLAHRRAISLGSLTNEAYLANTNGHHMNGDSIHSIRVEEESVPNSPHSPVSVNNRGKSYNIRMDDDV